MKKKSAKNKIKKGNIILPITIFLITLSVGILAYLQ